MPWEIDELGRGVAAISFGEVLTNLRSGDFQMGKPVLPLKANPLFKREKPVELKHLSRQRNRKISFISLVAASEQEEVQSYYTQFILFVVAVVSLKRFRTRVLNRGQ